MNLFILTILLALAIQLNAEDPNRKIKLEDIERDNLISERRAQGKETLIGQHTQHLRPPAIHAQSTYQLDRGSRGPEQRHPGGIVYAQQPSGPSAGGVQYVTAQPDIYSQKQYETSPQSQYTPVHEADRTYSAPSRHSLVNPHVFPSPAPTLIPQPQPQYVYVQAGQQQQQQQKQQQQHQQQHVQVQQPRPQPSQPAGPQQQYYQYVQYVPQMQQYEQPSQQQQEYVMLPYQQQYSAQSSSQEQQYSAPSVAQVQQYIASQEPTSSPDVVSYSHGSNEIESTDDEQQIQQYISSTKAPAIEYQQHHQQQQQQQVQIQPQQLHTYAPKTVTPLQYTSQPQQQYSQGFQYIQQHQPQQYQPQQHQPQQYQQYQQYQQQPQYIQPHHPFNQSPALDFFAYNNHRHQPSSLLESYIPSSVIYARQKALLLQGGFQASNGISSFGHEHQPAYNTIAYSGPHQQQQLYSHAKRASVKA